MWLERCAGSEETPTWGWWYLFISAPARPYRCSMKCLILLLSALPFSLTPGHSPQLLCTDGFPLTYILLMLACHEISNPGWMSHTHLWVPNNTFHSFAAFGHSLPVLGSGVSFGNNFALLISLIYQKCSEYFSKCGQLLSLCSDSLLNAACSLL